MIHILVVEDDRQLNLSVCTYLNDSGFQAKGCLNANDAYDEMYNSLYDMIISDIMMPEIMALPLRRPYGRSTNRFRSCSCRPGMICRPSKRAFCLA